MGVDGIRAVIFDIGGVILGSPIVGAQVFAKRKGLPADYFNALITAKGHDGAFQRLERGAIIDMLEYYEAFGRDMSDWEMGNKAYTAYCKKVGLELPTTLPTSLQVDGKELWETMMYEASSADPIVVNAILSLRRSTSLALAALTNNFILPEDATRPKTTQAPAGPVSYESIMQSIERERNSAAMGGTTEELKRLFDTVIESAKVGMRKPDPAFFQYALDALGVKGEETVFLDDIGINLQAAKQLGMRTIRVYPKRSEEAIRELSEIVGLDLLKPNDPKAKL